MGYNASTDNCYPNTTILIRMLSTMVYLIRMYSPKEKIDNKRGRVYYGITELAPFAYIKKRYN